MSLEKSFTPDKSRMISEGNLLRTRALFLEPSYKMQDYVQYVLSPYDHPTRGIPSIYRLYIEMEDLAEFDFANTYFLGMDHWRRICECEWFKPYLEEMRGDLQLKLKSRALARIKQEAEKEDSKNYFQSLKYLADKGYIEKDKKGRPSKAQVEAEAKKQASNKTELDDIMDRMDIPNTPLPTNKELN